MTDRTGLPAGRAVTLDDRVLIWPDNSVVLGGAPWRVLRIAPAARPFLNRLRRAGPAGAAPANAVEHRLGCLLLARGIVHPVAGRGAHRGHGGTATAVDVVVPAYGRPDLLDVCLSSLGATSPGARVIVVDDATPDGSVERVARAHGAQIVRHDRNRGPAAARNSGLRESTSPIVAFVDSDCAVGTGWLESLVPHFEDPRVGAVAPRILPTSTSHGVLARYQDSRSALDMGDRPELVAHGAPLGFLPSAALLVRRCAVGAIGFDEDLRLGEDVDLIWRLIDGGWLVRYEPAATVRHEIRPSAREWARQIYQYGTSAAALDRRHPGRLAPARLSGWNLAAAALLLAPPTPPHRRAAAGFGVLAVAGALLARSLRDSSLDPRIAVPVLGKGVSADAAAAGHLLRREWWPVGWAALALSPWSRTGRAAGAAMLVPVIREWLRRKPDVDLPRYLGLRLAEDAAYGSGVITGAVRSRRPGVLIPRVRLPIAGRARPNPPPR